MASTGPPAGRNHCPANNRGENPRNQVLRAMEKALAKHRVESEKAEQLRAATSKCKGVASHG